MSPRNPRPASAPLRLYRRLTSPFVLSLVLITGAPGCKKAASTMTDHQAGSPSADASTSKLVEKVRDKLNARVALNPLGDPVVDAWREVVASDEKPKPSDAVVRARAQAVLPSVEAWARHGDTPSFRGRATRLLADLRGSATPPFFDMAAMFASDYRPGSKEKADQARVAYEQATRVLMLELAHDPTPEVATSAAEWLLKGVADAELPALRAKLASVDLLLARAAQAGDVPAGEALLRLRGGPQAVAFLVDLASGKAVPLSEPEMDLAKVIQCEPTPAARQPLEQLLTQKLTKKSWHGAPTVSGGPFDGLNMEVGRVELLVRALCAVDYEAAKRIVAAAPEAIRPKLEKELAEGSGKCPVGIGGMNDAPPIQP